MKAAWIVAALVALSGCTTVDGVILFPESRYTWFKSGEAYPATWQRVDQSVVLKHCPRNFTVLACAVRDDLAKTCTIYTRHAQLPEQLTRHEEKHCAGWSHLED